MNYTSFVPFTHRTGWIRRLVTRALKICSSNKLSQELQLIKKLASWNDFPKYIVNSILCKTLKAHQDERRPNLTKQNKTKQNELVAVY